MSTTDPTREHSVRALMGQLESAHGRLAKLPRSLIQNTTTAVAAVAVTCVALSYLLGVAGLIWLTLDYGISHARLIGQNHAGSVVLYLILAVFLLVFLALLVKPALRWGQAEGKPHTLARDEQPELYAFVDRLSELLGTPKPERIEVYLDANASASLSGFAMGLFSRRPVLSLGLTLTAGMDLKRFTGVIAHELAHFTQDGSTRFRLVINAINSWFARVVFERDRFDLVLARGAGVPLLGLLLVPVQLVISLGRCILWVFMLIAHAASGLVSRRGEYEADKYMAAVIGGKQLGPTLQRIAILNMCMDSATADLRSSYMAGRLANDVPLLASARAERLSDEHKQQLVRLIRLERQSWHSTHPTLVQRNRAARRFDTRPLIDLDGPATALFRGFEQLCEKLTAEAYDAMLGDEMKKVQLIPTSELLKEIDSAEEANKALGRFYQCQPSLSRPLLPGDAALAGEVDRNRLLDQLAESRGQMLEAIKPFEQGVTKHLDLQQQIANLTVGLEVAAAGIPFNPAELGLRRATPGHIKTQIQQLQEQERAVLEELGRIEQIILTRLTSAAALLGQPEVADHLGAEQSEARRIQIQKIIRVSRSLERTMSRVRDMMVTCEAFVTVLQLANRSNNRRALAGSVDRMAKAIRDTLVWLKAELGDGAYPFEHAEASTTISAYAVPSVPTDLKDYERLVMAASETNDRYQMLVARCMSVAAETAEQVEVAAGFAQGRELEVQDDFDLMLRDAERGVSQRPDAALSESWVGPLATAAIVLVGIFLGAAGTTSITPTVTSAVVPRHAQYEPTFVPAAVVDPAQGPRSLTPSATGVSTTCPPLRRQASTHPLRRATRAITPTGRRTHTAPTTHTVTGTVINPTAASRTARHRLHISHTGPARLRPAPRRRALLHHPLAPRSHKATAFIAVFLTGEAAALPLRSAPRSRCGGGVRTLHASGARRRLNR